MSKIHLTSARKAVLETLEDTGTHLTAAHIHEQLTDRLPSLNLSTVYRSLDYLVEHELISVSDIGVGSPVYELLTDTPHHHLVCLNCGRILQVDHQLVAPFFETLRQEKTFTVQTNHLVLYGLCADCQEKSTLKE